MGYELGWQCPNCQAFHAQPECDHDQSRPCRYCTLPVGALSTGGPDVCSRCEVVGVPPDIYMGLKPARNFHATPLTENGAGCGDLRDFETQSRRPA